MIRRIEAEDELIEVRRAAALVGRHPETIRRWVWSGRLAARRRGRQLLVARSEVEAIADRGAPASSLAEWAEQVRAAHASTSVTGSGRSAAGLIIEDRLQRTATSRSRAGR